MKYTKSLLLLVVLLGMTYISGMAQRGAPRGNPNVESDFNSEHTTPDTLDVGYRYFGRFDSLITYADTLRTWFHEYDINRIQGRTYFNLGFPGSAALPVLPEVSSQVGFRLGLNQYDVYRLRPEDIRFYSAKKAFTHARFTQGPTQEDGVFSLQFGREFKDNISLSMDYRRTNNTGFYENQSIRNTNFSMGLRYVSKNGKWRSDAAYVTNRFRHAENGGITTDTLFRTENASIRQNIPVGISSGQTQDQEYGFHINTQYLLSRDSTSTRDPIGIGHVLSWNQRKYLFADASPESSEYYGIFNVDTRGLRNAIDHRILRNDFYLSLGQTAAYRRLVVGMRNQAHRLFQDQISTSFVNWIAHGDIALTPTSWLFISAKAELALGNGFESYTSEGKLTLELGGAGRLEGLININSVNATQIAQEFAVSQDQIWQNSFKNILQNHLRVSYLLPGGKLRASAGQLLVTNGTYFSAEGRSMQDDGTTSLSYLSLYSRLRWGPLVTENKFILQFTNSTDVFRVPRWHTENSLYLSGRLFKKVLNVDTGFDFRLFESYEGLTYHPLLGQFVIDNEFETSAYPVVDFRVNMRVRYFRAFIKLENILNPIRNDVPIQISRYPQQDFNIRIGIGWTFIN
ncbi:MAG: putative porin [Saprospiraceae bacterium]|nr:putative porin [Saprospiraceae bacterium]